MPYAMSKRPRISLSAALRTSLSSSMFTGSPNAASCSSWVRDTISSKASSLVAIEASLESRRRVSSSRIRFDRRAPGLMRGHFART